MCQTPAPNSGSQGLTAWCDVPRSSTRVQHPCVAATCSPGASVRAGAMTDCARTYGARWGQTVVSTGYELETTGDHGYRGETRRHVRNHHTAVRHRNPTQSGRSTPMPTCTIHGRTGPSQPTDASPMFSIASPPSSAHYLGRPKADHRCGERRQAVAYLTPPRPTPADLSPPTAPSNLVFILSILG